MILSTVKTSMNQSNSIFHPLYFMMQPLFIHI